MSLPKDTPEEHRDGIGTMCEPLVEPVETERSSLLPDVGDCVGKMRLAMTFRQNRKEPGTYGLTWILSVVYSDLRNFPSSAKAR